MEIKCLSVAVIFMLTFTFWNNNAKNEKIANKQVADTAATGEKRTMDIPFTVAKNYFVKNTVKQGGLENPKIETKENFDSVLGASRTMNKDGRATEIAPVSLQKDDKNRVELNYRLTKGNKQSFKIRPVLIVIVDKIHDGPVSIKEQTD